MNAYDRRKLRKIRELKSIIAAKECTQVDMFDSTDNYVHDEVLLVDTHGGEVYDNGQEGIGEYMCDAAELPKPVRARQFVDGVHEVEEVRCEF